MASCMGTVYTLPLCVRVRARACVCVCVCVSVSERLNG